MLHIHPLTSIYEYIDDLCASILQVLQVHRPVGPSGHSDRSCPEARSEDATRDGSPAPPRSLARVKHREFSGHNGINGNVLDILYDIYVSDALIHICVYINKV